MFLQWVKVSFLFRVLCAEGAKYCIEQTPLPNRSGTYIAYPKGPLTREHTEAGLTKNLDPSYYFYQCYSCPGWNHDLFGNNSITALNHKLKDTIACGICTRFEWSISRGDPTRSEARVAVMPKISGNGKKIVRALSSAKSCKQPSAFISAHFCGIWPG